MRRLDYDRMPQAALFSSVFFAASLFTVPVGPSSVHLMLNGLMGLVLGWTAVPAILIALLLQAVFFGFGGLIVLGVNTMNMALPAIVCSLLFGHALRTTRSARTATLLGAATGALAVVLTGALVCLSLAVSGQEFLPAAKIIIVTFLPLMAVEAAVTAAAVGFLQRVAPRILGTGAPAHG